MKTLYTAGYTATWTPESLRVKVDALNAQLWDIRYSPFSRHPRWRLTELRAAIGPAYRHMRCLGNLNYRSGGPITLSAPEQALEPAAQVLAQQPIILLCACKETFFCHRLDASRFLAERLNCEVIHL